ncbi:MAG: hypothetical protein JNK78_08295 [Planctomycetes bacterium]|nr:hypothetical protein [Planctomycetota bacterium]
MVKLRLACWLGVVSIAGCVAYERDDSDAASVAATAQRREGGAFTWGEAVATALRQNAGLQALEAEARAAGAVSTPIDVDLEFPTDFIMLSAIVDPVALLGLGARGAAIDVARAEAAAAAERLAVARWRTIAAVTEAFVVEASLAAIATPGIEVDATAFERAGLASPLASAQLRTANARLAAERSGIAAERDTNRARLRELLGLPADADCRFAPGDGPALDDVQHSGDTILARPDLALATAEFRVADAAFALAVAEQYPSLRVGPDIPMQRGLGVVESLWQARIPFATAGAAEAARERREAARARLLAAWLRADAEAVTADRALAAARAADDAATTALEASTRAFAIGKAAIRVEEDAFDKVAQAAAMVARDAMERRVAALARARAEVARAVALGWPASGQGRSS